MWNKRFLLTFFLLIFLAPKIYAKKLSVTVCPETTNTSFLLILFVTISIILIIIGLISKIGFIGFFGSIALMVCSWYIAPCINIAGLIIALLSVVLMFYFIFRNLLAKPI